MDKFQDAYRDAVKLLPELQMDADRVKDELHHYKMKRQKRNSIIVKGCTAAAVFLLCGVGTVAAKNYRDSIIRVSDNGVIITAQQADEDGSGDIIGLFSIFEHLGGVFSIADTGPDEEITEIEELAVREYDSLESFLKAEDVIVALPDKTLFGVDFITERVSIVDHGIDVSLHMYNESCSFLLTQFDNREVGSYSTSMSFGGKSGNERSFTNSQGMSYVVFDTLDDKGKVISTCAVISVNGWDLTLTFKGFEKKTVEKIINSIDLSIYF